MIAIGAGDRASATRHAMQARKALPNEPLTHLLRAQAAQLSGDRTTARRIFEAMLSSPETEQLGLRGLFLEAEREGEPEAARQFAERATRLNPKLGWSVDALFDIQCRTRDWDGALETLAVAKRHQQIDKTVAERRRAVLLTARAQDAEEADPQRAMQLAMEAHSLAPDLIPAAAIASRLSAARGNTKRAATIVERTWRAAPHPELAMVYAHARLGDSPRDRLERVKRLAPLNQHSIETPIAIAAAAIEAHDWDLARMTLAPLTEARMTQRVCTLMARIEGEEHGDKGRVREWLARAVHAPRDAAWTTDGVVSDRWAPVSPVTGALDAFQWRVPVEALQSSDTAAIAQRLDELAKLGGDLSKPAITGDGHDSDTPVSESRQPVVDTVRTQPATPTSAPAATDAGKADAPPRRAANVADAEATTARPAAAAPPVRPNGTHTAAPPIVDISTSQRVPSSAAADAARPASAHLGAPASIDSARKDPKVQAFIAPRAPDDPGPVADDDAPPVPGLTGRDRGAAKRQV